MTKTIEIRPVGANERADWEPLWQGYLTFYKATLPQAATDTAWARFHDAAEPMFLLGAYVDGKLTGIVQYLYHRSTWTPGDYCYLQDLFVADTVRGAGIGRRLIAHVYEAAKAAGCSRVHWLTHETNTDAMLLYDRIAERSGFVQYRKIV